MTQFTIASFNVKNLIGPDKEYYKFQQYTPEEYAWKQDWMADQLLTMDADIVGFQEIFEEDALRAVIAEADTLGQASNAASIPDKSKRYHRKAIFRKLAYTPYGTGGLAFAPNAADGGPGARRPGVAIVSRFGFVGTPEVLQDLPYPLHIPFSALRGDADADQDDAGFFRLHRLSRPILKARVPVSEQTITVFNCHLKSKLGEHVVATGAPDPSDLTQYDAATRALVSLRAALRRMAEAWVLRRAVLAELEQGHPVMVLGDFNDGELAVSSEIISGEVPFENYAWMLRHDAQTPRDRYSDAENLVIRENIDRVRLHSAERLFVRKSARDMVYTSAFSGTFESIDQIYMSRHFHPDFAGKIGEMEYFSVLNDHLTDGSHSEAPYNKLASDHGQIIAHMRIGDDD
jgi:endonuclease/exonuclease/phosphatase family metal-dependent hydrolase